MLYETLLQGKIFLCCAYFGILASFVFEIKFLLAKLVANNKVFDAIFEALAMVCCTLIFWFCISKYNFGTFRLFEIVGFCIGFAFERLSLHKLLEKNLQLIYTLSERLSSKLKKTKLFGKIFK